MSERSKPYDQGEFERSATPAQRVGLFVGKIANVLNNDPDGLTFWERRSAAKSEKELARYGTKIAKRMDRLVGFVSQDDLCEKEKFEQNPMNSFAVRQGLRWLYDNDRLIRMIKTENDDRHVFYTKADGIRFSEYPESDLNDLERMPNGQYYPDFRHKPHEYYALLHHDDRDISLLKRQLETINSPPEAN